jgi:hypothetical protein
MSQSGLTITRTFDPTVTYLRGATRVTYSFTVRPIIPGVPGFVVTVSSFRDKEIKSAISNIVSATFKNLVGVINNLAWSFDPALGITITTTSGGPIVFTPGTTLAKFDLVMVLENGQNVGMVGPTFQNVSQFDITTSNQEVPPFLISSGNSWNYYNIGPPPNR